jgi:inner membrane protein
MASAFSHAVAALGIGSCFYTPRIAKAVWSFGMLCAVIPDLDSIGFRFHVPYAAFWGHRGFTHSLIFASLLALVATMLVTRFSNPGIRPSRLLIYLFLATATHGVLDAMTNGGLGVAFFSPFSNHRYFFLFDRS